MYWVTKETGTYADTLLAYGAARLLRKLGGDRAFVAVVDAGDRFELRADVEPEPGKGDSLLLYPFVSIKPEDGRDEPGDVIRYGEERAKKSRDDVPEPERKARGRSGRRKGGELPELPADLADALVDQEAVRPEIRLISLLRSLDKGLTVNRGNDLRQASTQWSLSAAELLLKALCDGWTFHRAQLARAFGTETLGQILNPYAGKGTNRDKPVGPTRGNLEAPAVEEWLKYAGLYSHAYVRSVKRGDNRSDIEILVPIPGDVPLAYAERVMSELRQTRVYGNSVQFEILATLTYARILASHHKATALERLVSRRRLNRIISGLQVAYFQDLGGGKPVTGMYTLGLPGFFDLLGPDDVNAYLAVLDEHRQRVGRLNEKHSDHMATLLQYRDYLSSGDVRIFLDFLCTYGTLALRSQNEQDLRARLDMFSCAGIERVVKGEAWMKLPEVVNNAGFRSIARAMRRSTTSEMYWKSVKKDQIYEIRYGLGQELRRHAARPAAFLAEIAKFTQSYNDENARVREHRGDTLPPHRRRQDITDADLDAVVGLISKAEDPEAVALLLIGYGYAREEREEPAAS